MGANKPRNIRDIAHLYLSRSSRRSGAEARVVLVAGVDRDCYSAFHAVNIAAAMAARGHGVRLAEISDEPLNAGFFLALPPGVYVDPPGDDVDVAALGQVTLTHSFSTSAARRTGGGRSGPVHIVHLPPVDTPAHTRALRFVTDEVSGPATLLYLTASEDGELDPPDGVEACTVAVRGDRVGTAAGAIPSLGRVDRWKPVLGDPIVPVVRDPQSVLARSYQSLCDALVSPLVGGEPRRPNEEPHRARGSIRAYRKTRSTPFGAR